MNDAIASVMHTLQTLTLHFCMPSSIGISQSLSFTVNQYLISFGKNPFTTTKERKTLHNHKTSFSCVV